MSRMTGATDSMDPQPSCVSRRTAAEQSAARAARRATPQTATGRPVDGGGVAHVTPRAAAEQSACRGDETGRGPSISYMEGPRRACARKAAALTRRRHRRASRNRQQANLTGSGHAAFPALNRSNLRAPGHVQPLGSITALHMALPPACSERDRTITMRNCRRGRGNGEHQHQSRIDRGI